MKVIKLFFTFISCFLIQTVSFIFMIIDWWLLFINQYDRFRVADKFLVTPAANIYNILLTMRLKVYGKEHVDKKRTTLYICNHQSWVDIPVLIKNSHASALSKKEVKLIPIIGLLTIYAGALFFDRKNPAERINLIKGVMKYFRNGSSLCLFPEGTRSENGELLEPQFPIIKLCYKQKIPVVPAAIEGSRNVLGKNRLYYNFFQKVILKYMPPVYPEDYSNADDFCNACWDKVQEAHQEILQYFTH